MLLSAAGIALTCGLCYACGSTERSARYKHWLCVDKVFPVAWVREPVALRFFKQEPFAFNPLDENGRMYMNAWTCVKGVAHFLTQDEGKRAECVATLQKSNIPHVVSIVGLFSYGPEWEKWAISDLDLDETMPLDKADSLARSTCNPARSLGISSMYRGYACYRVQVSPNWCDEEQHKTFLELSK